MSMLQKIGFICAAVLGLPAVATFGPVLLRRDVEHYRWDGVAGAGMLAEPIGIAYADGRLFVSDASKNRIVVFDTSGAVRAEWGDSALGLARPMHLSLGADGLLRVAEYLTDRVSIIDLDGTLVRAEGGASGSGRNELDAPGGAAALGDRLFIADFFNHRVQVFSPRAGRAIGEAGRVFKARFHYPTDVAVDDSLLYVADAYNHRIQVFRPNGEYVRRWGGPFGFGGRGPFRGWFRVATGLAVSDGRVYVADFDNDRVQIFTDRGKYRGQVADSLSQPTDVAIGAQGELYVVDFGHKRVVRFRPLSSP